MSVLRDLEEPELKGELKGLDHIEKVIDSCVKECQEPFTKPERRRASKIVLPPKRNLKYCNQLVFSECGKRGLARYVQIKHCNHVACIFCYVKDRHPCKACKVPAQCIIL